MKTQMTLLTATLLLLSSSAEASQAKISGTWKLDARVCLSGGVPKDAFVLGRDHLEFEIKETSVAKKKELKLDGTIRVQGKSEVFKSKVRPRGIAYEALNPVTGKTDLMIYNQPSNDTLQVYTAGFDVNGSCPKGDLLKTTFLRIERKPAFPTAIEIALK